MSYMGRHPTPLDPMQNMMTAMTPKFAVSYLRVSTRGQAERGRSAGS